MTIRDRYQQRLTVPTDGRVEQWRRDVTDTINGLPPFSTFSYVTPESNVTAIAGTLGVNLASDTTLLWYKQTGDGNTGWDSLATSRSYA